MTDTRAVRDSRRTLQALTVVGRKKPKTRKLGMIDDETRAELEEYYAESQRFLAETPAALERAVG